MRITYAWLYSINKNKFPAYKNESNKSIADERLRHELLSIATFTIRNKHTGIPLAWKNNDRSSFSFIEDSVISHGRILMDSPFDLTPEFDYKTRLIPFLYYSPKEFQSKYRWAEDWKHCSPKIEVPCIGDFSIFISLTTELPHSLKDIEAFHILESYIYFDLKEYIAPIPFVFKDGELDHLFNRNA